MKIRTDFVTNSSSSSFIVRLMAELSDGVILNFASGVFGGDVSATFAAFSAMGQNGEYIYDNEVSPNSADPTGGRSWEVDEYVCLGPGEVDMNEINKANSVESLIMAIKKPFLGEEIHYPVSFDDEYEFEDETAPEVIEKTLFELNQMVDVCDSIMNEHIKTITDVKNIAVTYEFGGRGELLAGPIEILDELFGWNIGHEIYDEIDKNSEVKATEILMKMNCFKNVDEESIKGFISFVKECDRTPDECTVVLTINADGKLHYMIDFCCEQDFS